MDSGNIISDDTFCAQIQIMVEKFPNFRQKLSAFVRGWQLVAVGVTCLPKNREFFHHNLTLCAAGAYAGGGLEGTCPP